MTELHRVLIVEDDERHAAFLKHLLEEQRIDFDVELSHSGEEGLRNLFTASFDLVLLDDTLPDMSSAEFIDHLRKKDLDQPYVIGLTEYSDVSAEVEVLQHGADQFLPKSLNLRRTLPVMLRRALSERALRKNADIEDADYLALLEKTSDAIYILGEKGFLFVNQRFEQLFAYSREEVVADDFDYVCLIAPESRALVSERSQRSARGELLEPRYEFTALNSRGEPFDVAVSVAYIQHNGESATLGILQDVTERKAFEKALVRRNHQLDVLNDIAATVNSSLDLSTVLDIASERLMRVMNLSAAGISLVDHGQELLHSAVLHGVTDAFRHQLITVPFGEGIVGRAAASKKSLVIDDLRTDDRVHVEALRHTGFVSAIAVPILVQGQALGVAIGFSDHSRVFSPEELDLLEHICHQIGTAIDKAQIHEKQKATVRRLVALDEITRMIDGRLDSREVFALAATQLRRLVGANHVSITMYDSRCDYFRFEYFALDGVETDAPSTTVLRADSILGEAIEYQLAVRADLAERAGEFEAQLRALEQQSVVVVPIVVERSPVGTLNLSWRQRGGADEDTLEILRALAAHLAVAIKNTRLVSNLEAALSELKETQERAIETSKLEALGEMAAGVAHDFNNVLGAILGRAQLLKKYIHDQTLRKNIDVIEQAALDGAATVQRVQQFSRADQEPDFSTIELRQIMRDAVDYTQPRWRDRPAREGRHVELELNCDVEIFVLGNAHELREVLTNLINNACDAMPNNGHLSLTLEKKGDEAHLSICDDGKGMSVEVQKRIFDPFFTTKGVRGNGLGLSVSQSIIKQHQGRFEVQSQEGQGTEFKIFLPAIDPPAEEKTEGADVVEDKLDRSVSKARILVVDDEESIRDVLFDILDGEGHEVLLVEDAEQGLEAFGVGAFDLVFTDLGMPGMNGLEFSTAIRARDSKVPIGLLTGWGTNVDKQDVKRAGVSRLLAKPFDFEDVLQMVEDSLKGDV